MRAVALAAFLIGLPATAFAGEGFDIVVPGRPGVPIIINNCLLYTSDAADE